MMVGPTIRGKNRQDHAFGAAMFWLFPMALFGWCCITVAYTLDKPDWKAGAFLAAAIGSQTGLYVAIRTRRMIVVVPTILLIALLIVMIFELLKQF